MTDLSICIVNWNTSTLLRQCLDSIYRYTEGIRFEIIVVDNASRDDSVAMVRSQFPEVELIALDENAGFTRGNNVAANRAAGHHILFLNPDTELKENAIAEMARVLDSTENVGITGCRLLLGDGSIQHVCARAFPTPRNQFNYLAMLDRLFPKSAAFAGVELRYWDHRDSRLVECISGACMMIRAQLFRDLGGFDENIFMYADDVDLCYRVYTDGWQIYYNADATIYHYAGSSSRKRDYRFFSTIMQRESNRYFLQKHFGRARANRYRIAVLTGSIVRLIVISVFLPATLVYKKSREVINWYSIRKYFSLLHWSVGSFFRSDSTPAAPRAKG
jgi:GT2 family glycosyltransferase